MPPLPPASPSKLALGLAVWSAGWLLMVLLDGYLALANLANLAMALVLTSALATLWLPTAASVACSALAVVAFNWSFVPPRRTFSVERPQDALLLGAMLAVSWIVAGLMARQRRATQHAQRHARHAEQLRAFGEALREDDDAAAPGKAGRLQHALAGLEAGGVALLIDAAGLPERDAAAVLDPQPAASANTNTNINAKPTGPELLGDPSPDELQALWQCARSGGGFAEGMADGDEAPAWLLPIRGRRQRFGAAVLRRPAAHEAAGTLRRQAQALCDQFGLALERAASERSAAQAREAAQAEAVRNAMLASISHDYRTPLATILGAASSLTAQDDKLDPAQRQRLAQTIADEAVQLGHLTDNTLQLARLSSPGVRIPLDWESPEELVGALLRRVRPRDPAHRVRARLAPGLPLLRCNAQLIYQLLDNLLGNALRYSAPGTPIELVVRQAPGHVVLALQDRGFGVAPGMQERIFQAFERAPAPRGHAPCDDAPRAGAGLGLAVCRAIAQAHGGQLRLRARTRGGSSFECWLPLAPQPPQPPPQPEPEPAPEQR